MAGELIRQPPGSDWRRRGARTRRPIGASLLVPLALLESAWLFPPESGVVAFPATLPRPQVAGYEVSPQDATVRTDFEAGPARVRRVTASPGVQVALAWRFSDAELASFRTWFTGALLHGSAWFSLDLALGGGIAPETCRFVGPYKARPLSGATAWDVSATVELRDA